MRTVMVAKQKGGVGAPPLARELGVAAAAAGKRVVLVDLDPQGTLRGWWNRRTEGAKGEPNPGIAAPAPARMSEALDQLRAVGADLLDAGPGVLDLGEEAGGRFVFVVTEAAQGKSRLYDDALPVLAQRGRV